MTEFYVVVGFFFFAMALLLVFLGYVLEHFEF